MAWLMTMTALLVKLALMSALGAGADAPNLSPDAAANGAGPIAAPVEIVRVPMLRAAPVEIARVPLQHPAFAARAHGERQ